MKCKSCNTNITPFFSLGKMPLANSFLKKGQIRHEKKYDLTVAFCKKCYLVQLVHIVPPKDMFRNYIYFSSTSQSFLEHCKKIAKDLTRRFKLGKKSLVLEIASNDGAQLQYFKKAGIPVLGIDPAKNVAKAANSIGIPTITEFFSHAFAKKLKQSKNIQADVVFGANVLAHVPNIVDFVKGVKVILKPTGTAVFEFPYLKGLMENKFDIIYQEHVFYYSLLALIYLFNQADMQIYDVEMTHTQGGSLRIFASGNGNYPISERVKKLIKQEKKDGFDNIQTFKKIGKNIATLKKDTIALLNKLKKEGKKIAAYSAPAKGNILLNYFGLRENYLDFIVDKSPKKHGFYTPGTHLLIHPIGKIYEGNPDYLLILCWNIADEVMQMKELKAYRKNKGKFIIPIPNIKIV